MATAVTEDTCKQVTDVYDECTQIKQVIPKKKILLSSLNVEFSKFVKAVFLVAETEIQMSIVLRNMFLNKNYAERILVSNRPANEMMKGLKSGRKYHSEPLNYIGAELKFYIGHLKKFLTEYQTRPQF